MNDVKKSVAKTFYIEGNVGVGKSTFLGLLQKHIPNIDIACEPTELWQNVGGMNLLEKFFEDQTRWAFTIQMYNIITRVDQKIVLDMKKTGHVQCIERSVFSGKECFAKNARDLGLMNEAEWFIYQEFWNKAVLPYVPLPSGFIYLRASAQDCFSRIKKRNRKEEAYITFAYVESLQKKYENWFVHKQFDQQELATVPVLILEYSQDILTDHVLQLDYMKRVHEFITKTF